MALSSTLHLNNRVVFNLFNPSIVHAQDASPPSWTGFYIGAGIGASFADLDLDTKINGLEQQRRRRCVERRVGPLRCGRYTRPSRYRFSESSSFNEGETYFFGTVQLGYNQQINNMFVKSIDLQRRMV